MTIKTDKHKKHNVSPVGANIRTARYCAALVMLLTACGAQTAPAPADLPETTAAETSADTKAPETSAVQETTVQEVSAPATESTAPIEYDYVHGEDGYFSLVESGIEYENKAQLSGTCWICASICSMATGYQLSGHEGTVSLDQKKLVDLIYNDDREEGVFLKNSAIRDDYGGIGLFVVNQLSLGLGDGLVLDNAIDAAGWSDDEIKEGIQKYGALYIGIPDSIRLKKRYFGKYFTMNFSDATQDDYDHSIAVIGWDDNFPKEYFAQKASRDGAWITYNSNFTNGYYYVSYDTSFDQMYDPPLFMSVTDRYSEVLSYDNGTWSEDPVITGDVTTTANVFKGEGTLAAVGTYSLADDQDMTIRIMTPDMTECLYSQDAHIENKGYSVIELDQPLQADEYAVSVSYTKGAPVEGKDRELDDMLSVRVESDKGQSFILIDDVWLDMSDEDTWEKCGRETNNACIRALYV